MNFTSPLFLIGFPFCLWLSLKVKTTAEKQRLLLAASWLFYLGGMPGAFPVLLLVTVITYLAGQLVFRLDTPASHATRQGVLVLTCLLVAGLLVAFKYAALSAWLLPPGISFYTFQSLAYVLDVAGRKRRPENSFRCYALFVSFFPQLVAGPIERADRLLPQLHALPKASCQDISRGVLLLLRGYVKKIVIADFLSPYVSLLFDAKRYEGSVTLAASLLFAFQIYADFSGYSDIARGAASLLGIRLSVNFRAPYLAANIREFWRCWHITLTRWFTDYMYIPLGGSRRSTAITIRNILIVFTISGLWHGSSLHFAVWGLYHGLLLGGYLLYRCSSLSTMTASLLQRHHKVATVCSAATTFLVTCLGWVFFRAPSLADAFFMLQALPFGWTHAGTTLFTLLTPTLLSGVWLLLTPVLLLGIGFVSKVFKDASLDAPKVKLLLFASVHLLLWAWIYNLSQNTNNAFLYFQF